MKARVLDSWAIIEWINGRPPASDVVNDLLIEAEQGRSRLWMSAINVGEVYYFLKKRHTEVLAASWREVSRTHCPLVTGDPELRLVDKLKLRWLGKD